MKKEIVCFGDTAKAIKPGDIFLPHFESVEGHDKVILKPTNEFNVLLEMYDTGNITLDRLIQKIRDIVEGKNWVMN